VSSKGTVSQNEKTDDFHLERIYAILEKDRIASKKYKVVIDHINGAGCRITQRMLAELGCDVIGVNNEPSGQFAHTPEPTARNLSELSKIVKDNHADIGFAQDPDADRLAIVDEHGRYIGEEYTLALAAKYIFSHNKGTAAANLSTSRMIDDIAVEYGCQVIRTPVGEANVADAMIQNHCVIGGEGNGGIIDLRVGPVRDSLVGIALVLQFMAETGKSISELVSEIPAYCMIKEKFTADKNMAERIIENAKEVFTDAAINTSDGCRFDLTDSWVHLRTSNTEPVMRAIVEAPDENTANELIEKIMAIRDFI
jgi:phosphomannomutase